MRFPDNHIDRRSLIALVAVVILITLLFAVRLPLSAYRRRMLTLPSPSPNNPDIPPPSSEQPVSINPSNPDDPSNPNRLSGVDQDERSDVSMVGVHCANGPDLPGISGSGVNGVGTGQEEVISCSICLLGLGEAESEGSDNEDEHMAGIYILTSNPGY